MMRTMAVEERLRRGRMEAKTRDAMFRAKIEHGAKCAPFVSAAILQTLKEVYPVEAEDLAAQVELGRVRMLVVAAHEPSGKKLGECQKVSVLLTLDQPDDDDVRVQQCVTGLRRARLLRMTVEAFEQGGLLTHEDLAFRLLNCGRRTIVRDVEQLRGAGLAVPTRGQQQDIGPGQTHRVQAVRLFLKGLEPREIARRLYHSLSAIENYVMTFARVVLLSSRGHVADEIAFVLRRSAALVEAYRELHTQHANDPACQVRLRELTQTLAEPKTRTNSQKSAKKGGGAFMNKTSPKRSQAYDASDRKTFHSALCHLLQTEFPATFGPAVTKLFADRVEELYECFHVPRERLKVGQALWAAVAIDDPPARDKRIENTRLVPIVLDLVTPRDIDDAIATGVRSETRGRKILRLFQQAYEQGAVLSYPDVSLLLHVQTSTICRTVLAHERETKTTVPRRGTIHDMGRSVTHKAIICYKRLVELKPTSQVASETYHSPEEVEYYVQCLRRVKLCHDSGMSPTETAQATAHSLSLVNEYLDLIQQLGLPANPPFPPSPTPKRFGKQPSKRLLNSTETAKCQMTRTEVPGDTIPHRAMSLLVWRVAVVVGWLSVARREGDAADGNRWGVDLFGPSDFGAGLGLNELS